MNQNFLQIHDYPSHDLFQKTLQEHVLRLQRHLPDCSRHIMIQGWRSPIGDWERGSTACPGLKALKEYVAELLPWPTWDFFTWFEVTEPGGKMLPHKHFEHEHFVRYTIAGAGSMVYALGNKTERVLVRPGELIIAPGIAEDSIDAGALNRRISIVLNANRVVKQKG